MVPKESSVWSFLVPKVSCPRRINLLAHGTSVYNISVTELYFLDLLTLGGYNEAIRGILYLQWIFFLQTFLPLPFGSVLGRRGGEKARVGELPSNRWKTDDMY